MTQSSNGHPSAEIIQKWRKEAPSCRDGGVSREIYIARQAADWQLDRCCEEISFFTSASAAKALRERCRPRPSLPTKQEARDLLDAGIYHNLTMHKKQETYNKLRALIDSLPDD
jgi:hypothetical protein